ncbi:MAG: protein phosphatase 2C domain-containing protein [Pseudomonadota bacterium]
MRQSPETRFDVASVLSVGKRDHQEDALASDFPIGADWGFVVLSDGMGGHAAGDVASKIVVTEVFSELKFQTGDTQTLSKKVPSILKEAALAANQCVAAHAEENPDTRGMGATLVAPVALGRHLYWISVGDSPLYLYRDQTLEQLNEDHSMAPQIDFMAETGLIDADVAKNHPDRNCLTSVLIGTDIEKIDCPEMPFALAHGDIIIAASDGLQFLEDDAIRTILAENSEGSSTIIADALFSAVEALGDPDQDNLSFAVIKVDFAEVADAPAPMVQDVPQEADKKGADNIVRVPEFEWADANPLTGAIPLFFANRRRKTADSDK